MKNLKSGMGMAETNNTMENKTVNVKIKHSCYENNLTDQGILRILWSSWRVVRCCLHEGGECRSKPGNYI